MRARSLLTGRLEKVVSELARLSKLSNERDRVRLAKGAGRDNIAA